MRGATKKAAIEGVSEELERRSQYLSSLIQRTRMMIDAGEYKKEVVEVAIKPERRALRQHERCPEPQQRKLEGEGEGEGEGEEEKSVQDPSPGQLQQHQPPSTVKVRTADMPLALQKRAFWCASEMIASMPKLENKRLALALKKEFDSAYGPAWHCIVGTSYGSYVTHSLGGFLYFSIGKVHVLLFRTAVEPIDR